MPELSARESIFQVRGRDVYELLAFSSADELYAVELPKVHEIVVPPPLTFVPRAPRAVLGVCSVRGRLITVVDLRIVLGLPEKPTDKRTRILLGRGFEEELVGLRVDEVKQVVRLAPSELELSGTSLGGESTEVVRGIGRPRGERELVLLDLTSILLKACV